MSYIRRLARLAALLVLVTAGSACIGRFRATNAVFDLNKSVSANKVAREAIFLGLLAIQAYSVTLVIDLFLLNTIDFWTTGAVASAAPAPATAPAEQSRMAATSTPRGWRNW